MARVLNHRHLSDKEIYSVKFARVTVQVTVTSRASVVKRWLSTAVYYQGHNEDQNSLVVGLGVEGTAEAQADTLQLCIGRRCLIFQVSRAERVPIALRTFLQKGSHTFVGFANTLDRWTLRHSRHTLKMKKQPLDMDDYASEIADASMNKVVEAWSLNKRNDIGTTSNWNKPYLSYRQIAYVTVDAYCAYRMGRYARV